MIIDRRTLMCDAEDAYGTAATRLEGSQIDLTYARDIAQGRPIYLVIQVTTAFASSGSATVNIILASDASAAVATDGSASTHWQSGALAYTVLAANYRFCVPIPLQGTVFERYLGMLVVTADATTTAGAITAFLSPDPVGWKAYPEATSYNLND